MKRFIAVLIVLGLLGGGVFFAGWVQLTVPPGSYGVIHSKTHGVDPTPVQEGKFRWIWYKIIPTNVRIDIYTLAPVTRSLQSSGTLPSGEVYAALAGMNSDFSWNIEGDFSFVLQADALPGLVVQEHLPTQQDLDTYLGTLGERIEAFILRRLEEVYAGEEEKMESLLLKGSLPDLDKDVAGAFPEIGNFSCLLKTLRIPDFVQYHSLRSLYENYLASQQKILEETTDQEARERILSRLRMDELTTYGELLTKYPVLLRYLALEKGIVMEDK
jgi:hypothetical protein